MNEPKQDGRNPGPEVGQPIQKRPYHKPGFVFERAFETMALSCGKISRTQQQCKFNTKVS
ncbi:MAG: hypothetical protein ABSG25_10900 [Bryobacteraceae bacterium]